MSKPREATGAVSVYVFEVETDVQTTTAEVESLEARGGHCAWCGEDPDEFGSHGICTSHAQQLIEQAATRRSRRGRR